MKEIGLWGPRVQKAHADISVIGFGHIDLDVVMAHDEQVALSSDARRREIDSVIDAVCPQTALRNARTR